MWALSCFYDVVKEHKFFHFLRCFINAKNEKSCVPLRRRKSNLKPMYEAEIFFTCRRGLYLDVKKFQPRTSIPDSVSYTHLTLPTIYSV